MAFVGVALTSVFILWRRWRHQFLLLNFKCYDVFLAILIFALCARAHRSICSVHTYNKLYEIVSLHVLDWAARSFWLAYKDQKKTTTKTTFANVSSSLFGSLIDRVNFLQSFSIRIVHEYRFVHGPSHFGSLWTLSPLMCLLKKNQFSNQNSLLVYALRLLTIILILWFVVVVGAAAVLSPSRSLSQFSFLVYNFQMENWQSCDFIIVNITVFTVAGCLHFRSAQLLRWNRKFSTTISTPQHLNLYRCICTYKTFIQVTIEFRTKKKSMKKLNCLGNSRDKWKKWHGNRNV